mmetsp:Transcript_42245/g.95542  ORF Transcript_42245/g.95542 Transcript_42245/m.95542 type:complete len:250 (+) Transcript_42245:165-914(+)
MPFGVACGSSPIRAAERWSCLNFLVFKKGGGLRLTWPAPRAFSVTFCGHLSTWRKAALHVSWDSPRILRPISIHSLSQSNFSLCFFSWGVSMFPVGWCSSCFVCPDGPLTRGDSPDGPRAAEDHGRRLPSVRRSGAWGLGIRLTVDRARWVLEGGGAVGRAAGGDLCGEALDGLLLLHHHAAKLLHLEGGHLGRHAPAGRGRIGLGRLGGGGTDGVCLESGLLLLLLGLAGRLEDRVDQHPLRKGVLVQ